MLIQLSYFTRCPFKLQRRTIPGQLLSEGKGFSLLLMFSPSLRPPSPGIVLLINLSHNPASSRLIAPSQQCASLHFPSTAKKIESSHQLSQDILIERVNLCNSSSAFLGSPFSRGAWSFQILPGFVSKAEAWG